MPSPEINAGDLDKRVTLLEPVYNVSEDEITGWNAAAVVWAAILPNDAREQTEASRTVATVMTPIIIRYRSDIDARWRVQYREHYFEIEGIIDIKQRHVQLQLNCKEVL